MVRHSRQSPTLEVNAMDSHLSIILAAAQRHAARRQREQAAEAYRLRLAERRTERTVNGWLRSGALAVDSEGSVS
jgi:hypothetical protein